MTTKKTYSHSRGLRRRFAAFTIIEVMAVILIIGILGSIVAVSVVDRWTDRLEMAADDVGLPLVVAGASTIPLATSLLRPERAGSDRLLAAWAAVSIHGAPVIVVDLGTATTVDLVDGDGFFQPRGGLRQVVRLLQDTSQLNPWISILWVPRGPTSSTTFT